MAQHTFKNNWIDAEPREGKQGNSLKLIKKDIETFIDLANQRIKK